jgi:UDP-2-acetamido-3-amino-2,3-dideoxy-glucuronate N-acetyltransferase
MPIANAQLGPRVAIRYPDLVNIYGCKIGQDTQIGPFVEIQQDSLIGSRCKISSHAFVCTGVTIEDEVFIGHGVMFTNDLFPRSTNASGALKMQRDWELTRTIVCRRSSIGSNATIIAGLRIGAEALVGAGAVVTRDVPDFAIVVGNPARIIGDTRDRENGNDG